MLFSIVGPIGPLELGIVLVVVLLIFGPKRLPDLGRSLGRGMREFKDSVTGDNDDKTLEAGESQVTQASADEEPAATPKPADAS